MANATNKITTGKLGEDLACRYLTKKGYKILERNYRRPWGELDIVSIIPNKTLVIVEVKTVRGANATISAESQVTKTKLEKLKRTASMYANQSRYLTDKGWRIDLLAINIIDDKAKIKHYENIG
ncbi:MAG: YraN family protein [Candidatus Colwellbacteria bacterium]|nr:YraN family protein [Candidatus Colwellbacteria bacterium]